MRRWHHCAAVMVTLAGVILAPSVTLAQGNDNPGVIPNQALPHGTSYGDWGAAWWNWALSSTLEDNPVADPTGENCGVDQSGHVWFLAGTFGDLEVVRQCTIPAGQMIFLPIINAAFWAPDEGCTDVESCQAIATAIVDLVDIVEAEIDGVEVINPQQYRAQSAPFALNIAEGTIFNEFGYPAGVRDPAVADGFYLMLAPLSPGEHVIHFRGGISAIPFVIDITYFLTVR